MSASTVQTYIANDYKMAVTGLDSTNWYMGPNQGSTNWISLGSFASFITNTSKIYGPDGSIFNNHKLYSNLPVISVIPGTAIQMGTSISSYQHSAFIYNSTGNTLANKLCAAHSTNQLTTVASFAAVYSYIRLLSFTTSDFAS